MKDSVNVRDAVDSGKSSAGAYLYKDAYDDKTFKNSLKDAGSTGGVVPDAAVSADGIVFGATERGGMPKNRQEQVPADQAEGRAASGSSKGSEHDLDQKGPAADTSGASQGAPDNGRGPLVDSPRPDKSGEEQEQGLTSRGGARLLEDNLDPETILKF